MARVGFLGTGLMGAPMVRNLLAARHAVQAWNRTAAKAGALAADGAVVSASPEEAVASADFVISMLSDGAATAGLIFDAAVTGALAPGAVWIDMCSARPEEARAQAAHLSALGHGHLDAPVSGGTGGAEAGTLAIMVGGAADDFAKVADLLSAMGRPVLVGPSGAGQLAKLANQGIVAVAIGAVAEAMLLVRQGGGDPAAVRRALKGGFADSTVLQRHGARMTAGDFAPGGPAHLQLKDLDNLLSEATSLGLELPVARHIRDRFALFCDEMDGGDLDHSGLYLELLRRNRLGGEAP